MGKPNSNFDQETSEENDSNTFKDFLTCLLCITPFAAIAEKFAQFFCCPLKNPKPYPWIFERFFCLK